MAVSFKYLVGRYLRDRIDTLASMDITNNTEIIPFKAVYINSRRIFIWLGRGVDTILLRKVYVPG